MASADPPSDGFPRPYGKYELLDRLGDGGMAEVFLASLPGVAGFRKTVVIKRILPHLARKRRFIEMFVAEASLAAEVRHRNVVQVYELGRVGDELYMAMEYVKGTDLRVLLGQAAKRGLRIPPWFSVHVTCEILEALGFAWNLEDDDGRVRRIVHRDVTPSNIFISEQGEVKLGDFGVARDDTQASRTRAGQLKGKLAYMAPEQLYSKPPDHRVDVFAAGVVLWEALAQRRLFGGRPEIEVMQAITQLPRRAPSEHVGDVPPSLDTVVLSAVEIEKNTRLASAQEFQHHLLEVLPSLRPQVRASDVRRVVAGLLGKMPTAEAELAPLSIARSGVGARPTSRIASFGPTDDGSEDIGDGPLLEPDYDRSDRMTPDLVGDLDLVKDGSPGFVAPRRTAESGSDTADRPRSPASTSAGVPVLTGRPIAAAASMPAGGELASATPAQPSVSESVGPAPRPPPVAPSTAREGLLSKTGSGGPQTGDDVDLDALVGDAVASIEQAAPTSSTVPKDQMLAGLEHRRVLDNSRQLKSERWSFILDQELYEGVFPFWIRDHEGTEVGPCSLEQVLQIAKVECQTGYGSAAGISTTRSGWLQLPVFLQMAGMDALASSGPPPMGDRPSWSGTAEEHSFASVLAALTRANANGRLIIETDREDPDGAFLVIEVDKGRPTYVWASKEELQIPQLLVSKRVIHRRLLPQVLHGVLSRRLPLGRVLAEVAGVDIRRYFPMLMKERLVPVFAHGYLRFAFDAAHTPQYGEPFAKTLLSPVPELTFRVVPRARIESRVNAVQSAALEPVRDFAQMVDALSFKPEHIQIADRLARGKRIGRMLDGSPTTQARSVQTVAYILLETELVRVQ